MASVIFNRELISKGNYDVIVAGGGVAGVAAALTARQRGKKVLLIEKSNILGGLATLGLIHYFVPMCNGRGVQIIYGMCDEWLKASAKYGYDDLPEEWKPGSAMPRKRRLSMTYSPYIFALQLTEMVHEAGIDLLFDCMASEPVMEGKVCKGIVTHSKSGTEYYECKYIIDTTGDADVLRLGDVPTVLGKNFYSYNAHSITLESCKKAIEKGDIQEAYDLVQGGTADMMGGNQPEDVPQWSGTTVEDVSDYTIRNHIELLNNIKGDNRFERDIAMIPLMPQFRTTCRIKGDYSLVITDAYKHFDDSVCVINDFLHDDYVFEVPLRCLCRKDYPNMLTAGRSADGDKYGWELLRVIPAAILTGQAAGEAAVLAIEKDCGVGNVPIDILQTRMREDNVETYIDEKLIPEDRTVRIDDLTEEQAVEMLRH